MTLPVEKPPFRKNHIRSQNTFALGPDSARALPALACPGRRGECDLNFKHQQMLGSSSACEAIPESDNAIASSQLLVAVTGLHAYLAARRAATVLTRSRPEHRGRGRSHFCFVGLKFLASTGTAPLS